MNKVIDVAYKIELAAMPWGETGNRRKNNQLFVRRGYRSPWIELIQVKSARRTRT